MSVVLWLIRHGETDWNRQQRLQGWSDIPLNATGMSQARKLATELEGAAFGSVISSDLVRAVETARLSGLNARLDPAWREMNFGSLEGAFWPALDTQTQAAMVGFDSFEPPGGETAPVFRDRVLGAAGELPDGDHAVFTHGGVVRLLQRMCGGEGFPSHGQVIKVDWRERAIL